MIMKKLKISMVILTILAQTTYSFCQTVNQDLSVLTGPYFGQKPPGLTPEIFAPGIVSWKKMAHSPMAISNDGSEIAWYSLGDETSGMPVCRIFFSRRREGVWLKIDSLTFKDDETINNLYFSDDNVLNCISFHYEPSGNKYTNYHYTFQRTEKGWINPERSQKVLTENYNGECIYKSLIITCSEKQDGFGGLDLYVSFKNKNGSVSPEINMGEKINTRLNEHYPSFSPDGQYFFFVRGGKYYWVSSKYFDGIISEL